MWPRAGLWGLPAPPPASSSGHTPTRRISACPLPPWMAFQPSWNAGSPQGEDNGGVTQATSLPAQGPACSPLKPTEKPGGRGAHALRPACARTCGRPSPVLPRPLCSLPLPRGPFQTGALLAGSTLRPGLWSLDSGCMWKLGSLWLGFPERTGLWNQTILGSSPSFVRCRLRELRFPHLCGSKLRLREWGGSHRGDAVWLSWDWGPSHGIWSDWGGAGGAHFS